MKKLVKNYENPLKTRSKQMLTEAFFEILKEQPGTPIRISRLCDKAGLARPTFYSHYNTIDDIPTAYFEQWLNDVRRWVDEQLEKPVSPMIDQNESFTEKFGIVIYSYWCKEVKLVKMLQAAGFEHVIIQAFIKAHEIIMKELVAPPHNLSVYFQNFLQSKAALVTYELYKYWIATDMKLSVQQLADITSLLNTRREIEKITKIELENVITP